MKSPATVLSEIDHWAQRLETAGVHYGHGTTNAQDEAAWLVLWSLGLPVDSLNEVENRPVIQAEQKKIATLLEARITTRKPAAYLTQEAWLQGLAFYIDERSIVPRSLIAEVIASGSVDLWLSDKTQRVLDLCTGNGSLAVLAALAWPDVQVDAADLSADALAVAAINVERYLLAERIHLIESDALAHCTGPYDLVLCNPPYVNAHSMATLPPEYLAEPALALDGNRAGAADGMDFVRTLLEQLPPKLSTDAVLVLEIGNERAHFEAAFPTLEAVWLETSAGEDQVLLLTAEQLRSYQRPQAAI